MPSPKKPPSKTEPKNPAKGGRPPGSKNLNPTYPPDVWDEIIDRHSEGQPIHAIVATDPARFPTSGWVTRHAAADAVFGKRYAYAQQLFADALFAESVTIADEKVATKTDVANKRVRIDTRLRIVAKLNPAKYAERVNLNHSGGIDLGGVDDATLNARLERKLHELGVVEMLRSWTITAERIEAFLGLFRVVELPTAPAPLRLLPGETEADL